jgi:hypothetical protein
MKKGKLLHPFLLLAFAAKGQTAFRHIAQGGNISNHVTVINDPSVNNRPEMILITTPDFGTGPYLTSTTGVWFSNGKWIIFNQNTSARIPENARFNVLAAVPGPNAFIHTATAANITGHTTAIDNPALNNQPNARILITQNWGNVDPYINITVYNNHPVGVYYAAGKWRIFNQDFAAMPANVKFNVYLDNRTFDAGATPSSGSNWFRFSTPATDGQPNALLFTTQYWTGVYNPNETGVWYNATGWTVFNQNRTAMPPGARFNILPLTAATRPDITFTTPAIGSLCPNRLIAGDREFAGHGPEVKGDALLRIKEGGLGLELIVNFTAKETTGDWSEVKGFWRIPVGPSAPAGQQYLRINSPTYSSFNQVLSGGGRFEPFEGCDGGEHTITTTGGLINRLTVVGDTGGGDISNDADCNCDTRITGILLNAINVTLGPR